MRTRVPSWLRSESPWPWLAHLGIYFFPWMVRAPRSDELLLTAVLIPTFLVLYVLSCRQDDHKRLPYAAGIAVLGAVGAPIMPTATVFFAYAAASMGWVRPLSLAIKSVGLLLVFIVVVWVVFGHPMIALLPALFFSVMTGFACVMSAEAAAREQALVTAHRTVEKVATLAERERIARDMHDLLGHQLSVVAVKADLARKLISRDPDAAAEELRDIQNMTREALHEVRLAVDAMKQTSVAVEIARARRALEASDVHLETDAQIATIPDHLERPVALIIREAITNVIRHAGADRCRLTLQRQANALVLDVHDNGKGQIAHEGHGLRGMRERVQQLGGRFVIDHERGTRLSATFPLPEAAAS